MINRGWWRRAVAWSRRWRWTNSPTSSTISYTCRWTSIRAKEVLGASLLVVLVLALNFTHFTRWKRRRGWADGRARRAVDEAVTSSSLGTVKVLMVTLRVVLVLTLGLLRFKFGSCSRCPLRQRHQNKDGSRQKKAEHGFWYVISMLLLSLSLQNLGFLCDGCVACIFFCFYRG